MRVKEDDFLLLTSLVFLFHDFRKFDLRDIDAENVLNLMLIKYLEHSFGGFELVYELLLFFGELFPLFWLTFAWYKKWGYVVHTLSNLFKL